MPPATLSLTALLLAGISSGAVAQATASGPSAYLMPDRAAEVALARSAAPKAISDSAAVLVLTRQGSVEAAPGTNGFVCLVARAFNGALSDTPSWSNPRTLAPMCLNPAAVRSVLPGLKQRAALVMTGLPAADVVARTRRAYAAHELPAPENGAMAYMMSRHQHLADDNPAWKPHVMFFYGGGRKASEWGAGNETAPIINGGEEDGTTVVLIPVAQWSDGTAF
jgi:hypothetical protein